MKRLALAVALCATGFPLRAQEPGLFELFASRRSASTEPLFGGLALSGYNGIFGVRVSGALHLVRDSAQSSQYQCGRRGCYRDDYGNGASVGAWMADADLILVPFRTLPIARALLLGFSPYAFAGIGGYGSRGASVDTSRATFSYGVGVQHELVGWLGLDAEARNRRWLHGDSGYTIGKPRDWTYRIGLTISFGGHSSAVPSITAPVVMTTGAPLPPVPVDDADAEEALATRAAHVLDRAEGLIGTPYRATGSTPRSGFDATGFVQYVMSAEGVALPRSARGMATAGIDVSTRVGSLRVGDLLFFANDGTVIDHVAIYAGRERIIHASASGDGVRYDVLGEGERGRWFAEHLMSARRVLAGRGARGPASFTPTRDDVRPDPPDRAPRPRGTVD